MKKPLAALTAVVALIGSGMTFAESSVELTVQGVLTTSACVPTLSNNGQVDHGKISAKDLNPTTPTNLPTARLQLTVACDFPTLIALRPTDNRAGSSTLPFGYGLGLIDNLQKIGTYWISLRNPVADNVAVVPIESLDGESWQAIDDTLWQYPYMAAFGDGSIGSNRKPIPIQNVISELWIDTQIAPAESLNLSSEVRMDGVATFTIIYI